MRNAHRRREARLHPRVPRFENLSAELMFGPPPRRLDLNALKSNDQRIVVSWRAIAGPPAWRDRGGCIKATPMGHGAAQGARARR